MSVKRFIILFLVGLMGGMSPETLPAQTSSWRVVWDRNNESDMFFYEVYRKVGNGSYSKIAEVYHPDTLFVDAAIEKGVLYTYRVKAVDSSYNKSDFSPEDNAAVPKITGLPGSMMLPPDTTVSMDLDDYVVDPDHSDDQLNWSLSGASRLQVQLDANTHVLTIQTPGDWSGTETLRMVVEDPDRFFDVGVLTISGPTLNTAPVLADIPDQTIQEGQSFSPIPLDDYVTDPDHSDGELIWTARGAQSLKVSLDTNRVATIQVPDADWFGQESIIFRVTDPDSQFAEDTVHFRVNPVNDPPVIADIPDQFIEEGETFQPIALDDFVTDVDHADELLNWFVLDARHVQIDIDGNRVATISLVDAAWSGMDTVHFVVRDPEGAEDQEAVIFGRTVRIPPTLRAIPDQVIDEGETFAPLTLDDYVSDLDNPTYELTWSYEGADFVRVRIGSDRVARVAPLDSNWFGRDTVLFRVTDPDGQSDEQEVLFIVRPVNDPPVVFHIPGQNIRPGQRFDPIPLNSFVKDVDDDPESLSWSFYGADSLLVIIDDNAVADFYFVKSNWVGADTIVFRATDPQGAFDEDAVILRVVSFNAPLVANIPDQAVLEGQSFSEIPLDDYVEDGDNTDAEIQWSVSGKNQLDVSITPERVARILLPDSNWFGKETLIFRATDPNGNWATDEVSFTVHPVNDPPVIRPIPDQVIRRGESFPAIYLDDYVEDVDNRPHELVWTIRGYQNLTVYLREDRMVIVEPPGGNWSGTEVLIFRATDPEGLYDETAVRFTVENVVDDFFPSITQQYFGGGQNVLIHWMTALPTRDYIEYGPNDRYGQKSELDSVYTTEHQTLLTGLEPNRTYYYRIVSFTTSGEVVYSEQKQFRTGAAEGINVFPIPFQAGATPEPQAIHFVNLPPGGILNIYNLLGERVFFRKIDSNLFRWNVKNNAGREVLSGLYIYVVRDPENNKVASGKLIIIR